MSEPRQKPGQSKQDYGTPIAFLHAVESRFGKIDFDLAARGDNCVTLDHYTPEQDSLTQDWTLPGVRVAFLNPPFGDIEPWAAKLSTCALLPRWTLMLVPASVDSHWYRDHVLGKMMIWGIPRMQFVGGESSYPKALMLCGAGFGVHGFGYWAWKR